MGKLHQSVRIGNSKQYALKTENALQNQKQISRKRSQYL